MTSYNHQNYISQAIESVLNQTYSDFELIIVDDASKDMSREIIEAYRKRDVRIRAIYHQSNKGISKTTNDGFENARGKFIAYIQSDDIWNTEKLEKQIRILEKDPSLVVWSDAIIIDAGGNESGRLFTDKLKSTERQKSGYIFHELVRSNFILAQSTIFETKIIKQIKFDQKLTYLNDYKFMIDVAKNCHFYFIPEPLVKYRIHGDNSILKNKEIWLKDRFIIGKYVLKRYGNNIPDFLKAKLYYRIGKYVFNREHYQFGRRFLSEAIVNNPLKTSYCKSYLLSLFKKNL
jgi:glycosyltransferase involved in cell wall biosynthesis